MAVFCKRNNQTSFRRNNHIIQRLSTKNLIFFLNFFPIHCRGFFITFFGNLLAGRDNEIITYFFHSNAAMIYFSKSDSNENAELTSAVLWLELWSDLIIKLHFK